ncbi:M20 family peptidase [Halobacteriovorax sp. CON-3]
MDIYKKLYNFLSTAMVATSLISCANSETSTKEFTSLQMKGVEKVTVKVDKMAAAKRLAKGVQYKTISNQDRSDFDKKAFRGYHNYLKKTYPLVHKHLKRERIGSPRPYSLLYTWKGTDPKLPPVVLMAHMDVVPIAPDSKDQWKVPPFSGAIKDGYIWGRGVLDDKNQIHGILEAAEMKLKKGFRPKRTTYFVFGHDEEVGGPEGAKHAADLLEKRGIKKVAFVLDESAPITPGIFPGIKDNTALIGIAQKGYVSLEMKIDNVGGHSSQPPKEANIVILADAVSKLQKAQFPYKIHEAVRHQYRYMGPELDKSKQDMYAAVAYGKDGSPTRLEKKFIDEMATNQVTRAMLHTTIAVTMFNAGIKDNVLPPSATAVVNFRPMPGDTPDVIIDYVKNVIKDDRITIRDISASTPATNVANPEGQGYKLLEKTIRQTWGNELIVSPFFVIGGSDSKHFQARKFAPDVYTITGIQLENTKEFEGFHGVNERIKVDEYAKTIGFFYTLFDNLQKL